MVSDALTVNSVQFWTKTTKYFRVRTKIVARFVCKLLQFLDTVTVVGSWWNVVFCIVSGNVSLL